MLIGQGLMLLQEHMCILLIWYGDHVRMPAEFGYSSPAGVWLVHKLITWHRILQVHVWAQPFDRYCFIYGKRKDRGVPLGLSCCKDLVARWANRAYFRIQWDSMKASVLWLHVQVPKLTPAWRRVAMKSLVLLSDVCVQKQGLGPGSMLANDLWAKDYGYLQPGWRMEALPMEELLGTYAQSTLICSTLLDSHKFLLALEYLILFFFFLGDPASSFVIV